MSRWIHEDFERPDPDMVQSLGEFPTGILSDCMNRFQAMDAGIGPLKAGCRLCGPAFTVQSMESCNWGGHQALSLAKPGDVLVVAARGGTAGAVWGHVMTAAAKERGVAGVVLDGCVRDWQDNHEDTLPIFCRGACPGGPHKGWPGNINVPVSCGGVPVLPGDIVVGDDDGVVAVPKGRAKIVLREAKDRVATEEEWYRRVADGATTADILGLGPATEAE